MRIVLTLAVLEERLTSACGELSVHGFTKMVLPKLPTMTAVFVRDLEGRS